MKIRRSKRAGKLSLAEVDALEFLYRLDKQIEEAHERRFRRCRR